MKKRHLTACFFLMLSTFVTSAFERESWDQLYAEQLRNNEHDALMMLQERYISLPDNAEKLYISTQIFLFYSSRNQPYLSDLPDSPTHFEKFESILIESLNNEANGDTKASYAKLKELINQTILTREHNQRALIEYQLCKLLNRLGEYRSAKFYCSSMVTHLEEMNVPFIPIRDAYRLLANNYSYVGDYNLALNNYLKIISTSKSYHDNSGIYNDIGNLFIDWERYQVAEKYLLKSLKLRSEPNTSPLKKAQVIHNLGELYLTTEELDLSLQYFQDSLKVLKNLDHQYGMALSYKSLGKLYTKLGNHDLSIAYLHQAMDMAIEQHSRRMKIEIEISLSEEYFTRQMYSIASNYAKNAATGAKAGGLPELESSALSLLSRINELTGNFKKSLEYYKRLHELEIKKSTIENINAFEALELMEQKLEIEIEKAKLISKNRELNQKVNNLSSRDIWNRILVVLLVIALCRILYVYSRTKKTSEKDSLTDSFNRLAILDKIRKQPPPPKDGHKNVLILFDLDNFKNINDNYGHPTGDIALKHISKTVMSILNSKDCIGRIGGEEFLVLLSNISENQIRFKVEEIRQLIEIEEFQSEDHQTVNLTASFSFLATSEKVMDFDVLYSILDQALYQAKRNGRNCTIDAYNDPIENVHFPAWIPTIA